MLPLLIAALVVVLCATFLWLRAIAARKAAVMQLMHV